MKTHSLFHTSGGPSARWFKCGLAAVATAAVLLAAAGAASAKPVITHDPVRTAVKGEPLGLRATVHDAGGRISSVSVFYASSRGMTPFRRDLSTTGAGIWFGTIPGHLIGPGSNLFYYVHADNLEGESTDTDWVSVRVIEPGVSAADMPSAKSVAQRSQRASSPAPAAAAASRSPAQQSGQVGEKTSSDRNKYLLPAALIVGGAAAVGGGIALASHSGGGGGGSSSSSAVTNGNYSGSYSICFEPEGTASNALTHCDSGPVSLYVENGSVQIVGIWGGEILTAPLSGSTFSAESSLSARGNFPASRIIVAGDIGNASSSSRVIGYSTDPARPGSYSGNISATRR
jgi:hypothetical protein